MQIIKNGLHYCIGLLLFSSPGTKAQVPVSEEPRHLVAFQNKYIRLLDVWLQPGDTTMYHIHSTPSLFVVLSNTFTGSQIKGENWIMGKSAAGTTWYRSFSPDILVHRVCNTDKLPFHVNDIEILSSYDTDNLSRHQHLPFPLLLENERAYAWQLSNNTINGQVIRGRGPMIAELVSGSGLIFHDETTKESKEIRAGKYLYIDPGISFYFTAGSGEMNMVLFEIK